MTIIMIMIIMMLPMTTTMRLRIIATNAIINDSSFTSMNVSVVEFILTKQQQQQRNVNNNNNKNRKSIKKLSETVNE